MASSEGSLPDHYTTLGLAPDASEQEVENAFHSRVREHLQNANLSEAPIRERARQVGLAYETLRDPAKRRAYDSSRAAAAPVIAEAAAPAQAVQRPVMFVPAAAPELPAEQPPAPIVQAMEPPVEPEPVETPVEPESVETPVERESVHVEPPVIAAVAADPVEETPPPEEVSAHTDEQAEHETAGTESAAPVSGSAIVASEAPAADDTGLVRRQVDRSSGVHRGALAGGALVIALGIGGLLLMRTGSFSGPARIHAVLPVAVPAGQPTAGGPATIRTAPSVTAPLPPAATTIPLSARRAVAVLPPAAAAITSPPARTINVKLPPPVVASAAPEAGSSDAAAASPAAAEVAAAAPPAAAPAPASAPAPAPAPVAPPPPPARNVQPFPRWLGGGLMNSDNPHGQFQGRVGVRFTVEPNGQVSNCRTTASSGDPGLDARTCGLVEQRLRFSPARNSAGTPMTSEVQTTYTWGRTIHPR